MDRAHRIGPLSNKPRIMIAKIHHDQVKEKIMQIARNISPLSYEGQHVNIFPDLTADVIKDRKEFDDTRQKLREAGIRHGFLFPARLIFTHEGATKNISLTAGGEQVRRHTHPSCCTWSHGVIGHVWSPGCRLTPSFHFSPTNNLWTKSPVEYMLLLNTMLLLPHWFNVTFKLSNCATPGTLSL